MADNPYVELLRKFENSYAAFCDEPFVVECAPQAAIAGNVVLRQGFINASDKPTGRFSIGTTCLPGLIGQKSSDYHWLLPKPESGISKAQVAFLWLSSTAGSRLPFSIRDAMRGWEAEPPFLRWLRFLWWQEVRDDQLLAQVGEAKPIYEWPEWIHDPPPDKPWAGYLTFTFECVFNASMNAIERCRLNTDSPTLPPGIVRHLESSRDSRSDQNVLPSNIGNALPDDAVSKDNVCCLCGISESTLNNSKSKLPKPPVWFVKRVCSYRQLRPWLLEKWPDRAVYLSEDFSEVQKFLRANPTV